MGRAIRRKPLAAMAAAVAVLVAAAACLQSSRPGVGDAGRAAAAARDTATRLDSVMIVIDNPNFLAANVRLFAGTAQVDRLHVGGHSIDTAYVQRWRFHGSTTIHGQVEPIGSSRVYPLGDYLLPPDAAVIHIEIRPLRSP